MEHQIDKLLCRHWAAYRAMVIEPHTRNTKLDEVKSRQFKLEIDFWAEAKRLDITPGMLIDHADAAQASAIRKYGRIIDAAEIRRRVVARCPEIYRLDEQRDNKLELV
jgi:hypothetical protein